MDVSLFTVGDDLQSVKTTIKTKPVALMAKSPIPMKGNSGYLVSPRVTIEDNWSKSLETKLYNQDDILQRTITIKAEDTSSSMMPDFVPSVPDGVSVSLMEPSISSNYQRGQHSATLTQIINYSIDKPGQYSLGDERMTWWNRDTKEAESWRAGSFKVDAGDIDYIKLTIWLAACVGALIAPWIMRSVWLCVRSNHSNLKQLLTADNPSWLNICYARIGCREKSPLLLDNSNNRELVRDSMQREFSDNKRVHWWLRLKLLFSI